MCDHMNSYPGTQVKINISSILRRPQIVFTERGTVFEGDNERGEFRMSGDFVAVKAEYSSERIINLDPLMNDQWSLVFLYGQNSQDHVRIRICDPTDRERALYQ